MKFISIALMALTAQAIHLSAEPAKKDAAAAPAEKKSDESGDYESGDHKFKKLPDINGGF